MFCPNCGAPANENQTCCTSCGAALTQQVSQANSPTSSRSPGLGLAIASMVLGILSLALFCIIELAIPCAIVGVALGGIAKAKAKKANAKSGMAVAGIACSCVSLGLLIIILLIAVGSWGLAISEPLF